jgi:hypothetical protein
MEIVPLRDKTKEHWPELCEQAANEQNLKKLHTLIAELSPAFEETPVKALICVGTEDESAFEFEARLG